MVTLLAPTAVLSTNGAFKICSSRGGRCTSYYEKYDRSAFTARTSGSHGGPLDVLELVLDEGMHPHVACQEEHDDEGVHEAVVQTERVDVDQACAVLLLVAEWQYHLPFRSSGAHAKEVQVREVHIYVA